MSRDIIKLDQIDVTFHQKKRTITAVKDVTIHIQEGDIYGIVGYSGAGKSTLVPVSYTHLGPIFEDMIYRGLVMTALEKGKKWGLDVLGSAVLFGVSHISNHGWVLTDFVFYMGGGLIFAVLFRMTKSIYWPIGLHIVYNGIGQILMLL